MPEALLGLFCVVVFAAALIAIGAALGVAATRNRSTPSANPSRQEDLRATARTVRQLVETGRLDADASARLFAALRDEFALAEVVRHLPAREESPAPGAIAVAPVEAAPVRLNSPSQDIVFLSREPAEVAVAAIVVDEPTPVHPLDAPDPAPLPPALSADRRRRRALADVLQSFLQEKNIRWGELVSGILIVGCSIALAISLRREIESLSDRFIYLPAMLFLAATAAIHGAGHYTLRRWKLRATSQGTLVIATLLIPINFLASILVTGPESRELSATHPLFLAAVAVGAVSFGALAYFAGAALLRRGTWRLWIAVMGTSLGQLLVSRLDERTSTPLYAAGILALPMAAYLVATIAQVGFAARRSRIRPATAHETLLVLGIAFFSLAAPVGLSLGHAGSTGGAIARLSLPLCAAAVAPLATGIVLYRRATSRQVAFKVVGLSLALLGGILTCAATAAAWPDPKLLIAVGLLGFISLTTLGIVGRVPTLHVPALACGSLAALVGFHLWRGAFAGFDAILPLRTVDVLFTGESGVALAALSALFGISAALWRFRGWTGTAGSYLTAAGGVSVAAVAIALVVGFGRDAAQGSDLATPVLMYVGLAALTGSYFRPDARTAWAGAALALVATIHGLAWNESILAWLASVSLAPPRPILAAALIYGLLASVASSLLTARDALRPFGDGAARRRGFLAPLATSALASTFLALPSTLWVDDQRFGEHAWYAASTAVVWLLVSLTLRSRAGFAVFQALATVTVLLATTSVCQRLDWWNDDLLDPRFLQILIATIGVWCLFWSVLRMGLRSRWPRVARLMRWPAISVDEIVLTATVAGFAGMALLGCVPGIAEESGIDLSRPFDDPARWPAIFAPASWIVLACAFAAVVGWLAERRSIAAFSLLFPVGAIASPLIAGLAYDSIAVASALRWSFAGLGMVLTILICLGDRFATTLKSLAPRSRNSLGQRVNTVAVGWTLCLAAIPILGLTTLSLVQAALRVAPRGPADGSFFASIGAEVSFGTPLAALVALLIVHAAREKRPSLMLSGAVAFQYLVNLGYFLPILKSADAAFDWPTVIGCLQWNALGLAAYSLVWFALRRWIDDPPLERVRPLFPSYLALAVSFAGATVASAAFSVVGSPDDLSRFATLGDWPGFALCLFGTGVGAWTYRGGRTLKGVTLFLAFVAATAGPFAIAAEGMPGEWRAYHILTFCWLGFAILATAAFWALERRRRHATWRAILVRASAGALAATAVLALRGAPFDPDSPWPSIVALAAVAVVVTALGIRAGRQAYAYAAALSSVAAAAILWAHAWPASGLQGAIELAQLVVVAVTVPALGWQVVELHFQRVHGRNVDASRLVPPMHLVAGALAVVGLFNLVGTVFVLTGFVEFSRSGNGGMNLAAPIGWVALAGLGALLLASLWDRRGILALPGLFVWCLIATCLAIDVADARYGFDGRTVFVTTSFAVATIAALTGHLWRNGASLAAFAERAGVPNTVARLRETSLWLPATTFAIALTIMLADLGVVLTFDERWMRVAAACGPALLAYGLGCQAQRERRVTLQYASLALACASAVLIGWADLAPGWRDTMVLERVVRLLIVFSTLTFALTVPAARWFRARKSDWLPVVERMATVCGVASIATLAGTLSLEAALFEPGVGTPFGHPYQFVAVTLALLGLIAAALTAALSPRTGETSLSEGRRQGCVYAAQFVAAALFAHVYMAYPQWFGALRDYWPYIVMTIAFAGVGAGELLRRGGVRTLAEPLQRTGELLPLLPAIGWWLNPALGIDAAGHYALLLVFAGVVYATLAMMRRSYVAGIAATLAGNAALWAALADYEPLALLRHPQTWLIPPALSVLVAAQILHRQLSTAQLTAVRYFSLVVIYASSTADIFIGGIGGALWEPMILATLSTIGVLIGIGLRIRAFLFLGSTFVLMSVVSMVWHAYANIGHVGIWWGFGIALGVSILVVFGLFEKHRADLTRLAHSLRSWEG